MTGFEIRRVRFHKDELRAWATQDKRHRDWPAVYLIDDGTEARTCYRPADVYVGESYNVERRLFQHLDSPGKKHLASVRVVLDDTYNKSVCLDLESRLIQLLAGDGTYSPLNRNDGITNADYYCREEYRESFDEIFEALRAEGVFSKSIPEIENSDLYKLSPFKALTSDQAVAVEDIVEGLFEDVERDLGGTTVVEGAPGTGKTVVAVYLLKLLADIATSRPDDEPDPDSVFADFFTESHRTLLQERQIGLVVPQQSLRTTIRQVFKRTPGLNPSRVLSPFQVGESDQRWDLLLVDEAHRLSQRASQSSGRLNAKFRDITVKLFDRDDPTKTQLDWIRARSDRQILLVDLEQSVRPADLPTELLRDVVKEARTRKRRYSLTSQMRVKADGDYVGYIREIFRPGSRGSTFPEPKPRHFRGYEFGMFEDVGAMHDLIRQRDAERGLARLVAGFAWEWRSRRDKDSWDIELDGRYLRWNGTERDWINSERSIDEVGSIHTVQGYDLNYAGVIIGNDLRYDASARQLFVDRANYFDKKGKQNNPRLGLVYSDEDLLRYITNVYAVLLTRGMLGTFVYVCDSALRDRLRTLIPAATRPRGIAGRVTDPGSSPTR